MQLSGIYIYPVKSLGGISLQEAEVAERGLRYDRRWMIVDGQGQFLTAREHPRMLSLRTAIEGDTIRIRPGNQAGKGLDLPLEMTEGEMMEVKVWKNTVNAVAGPERADTWISEYLGRPCRFVFMPDATHRLVDPRYAPELEIVSFVDGFPHLAIAEASLEELNRRMERPIPMARFRPNLVVKGAAPNEELSWARLRIGEMEFMGRKPSIRCSIPTIDEETGEKSKEPTRTLATYMRMEEGVVFGENMIHAATGRIRVGDEVEALERKESPFYPVA